MNHIWNAVMKEVHHFEILASVTINVLLDIGAELAAKLHRVVTSLDSGSL